MMPDFILLERLQLLFFLLNKCYCPTSFHLGMSEFKGALHCMANARAGKATLLFIRRLFSWGKNESKRPIARH